MQQANEFSTGEGRGFLEFGDLFAGYVLSSTFEITRTAFPPASPMLRGRAALPMPSSSCSLLLEGGENERDKKALEDEKKRKKRTSLLLRVCEGVDEWIRKEQQQQQGHRKMILLSGESGGGRQTGGALSEKQKTSSSFDLFTGEQECLSSFLLDLMDPSESSSSPSRQEGPLFFFQLFDWYLACERAADSFSWCRLTPSSSSSLERDEGAEEDETGEVSVSSSALSSSSSHREKRKGKTSSWQTILDICLRFPGLSSSPKARRPRQPEAGERKRRDTTDEKKKVEKELHLQLAFRPSHGEGRGGGTRRRGRR